MDQWRAAASAAPFVPTAGRQLGKRRRGTHCSSRGLVGAAVFPCRDAVSHHLPQLWDGGKQHPHPHGVGEYMHPLEARGVEPRDDIHQALCCLLRLSRLLGCEVGVGAPSGPAVDKRLQVRREVPQRQELREGPDAPIDRRVEAMYVHNDLGVAVVLAGRPAVQGKAGAQAVLGISAEEGLHTRPQLPALLLLQLLGGKRRWEAAVDLLLCTPRLPLFDVLDTV
mmetsp:Transcript_25480/g.71263  ORF Transcript_25480/g.71263 Transcript_25480/m.71263 type:complete len:224 (-) Transcript_25480:1264-1935(-)